MSDSRTSVPSLRASGLSVAFDAGQLTSDGGWFGSPTLTTA